MDNFDTEFGFLKKIRKSSKKIKDTKKKFDNLLNSNIVNLEENKNLLMSAPHSFILPLLKELNFEELNNEQVGRVQLILNYLDNNILKEYYDFFKENISLKEVPKAPEKPKGKEMTPENIKAYNQKISDYKNKILPVVEYYNSKINSVKESFNRILENNIFGDESLDVSNMRYLYFKFFNLDESYIKSFIKDVKSSGAEKLSLIKSIKIEDIKDELPDSIKHAYEVKFYFENGKDSELLESCKTLFESSYQKYSYMSETMRLGNVDWGLDLQRKNNMFSSQKSQQNNLNSNKPVTLDDDTDDFELEEIIEDFDENSQLYFCIVEDYELNDDNVYTLFVSTLPGVIMDDDLVGEDMYKQIYNKVLKDIENLGYKNLSDNNFTSNFKIKEDPKVIFDKFLELGYIYNYKSFDNYYTTLDFEQGDVNYNNFKIYISLDELDEWDDNVDIHFYSSPFYISVYDYSVDWIDSRIEKAFLKLKEKYPFLKLNMQNSENYHSISMNEEQFKEEVLHDFKSIFESYNMSFKTNYGKNINTLLNEKDKN